MGIVRTFKRVLIATLSVTLLAACVTDPNAPPEPGSEKWYVQRIQEIEAAKAAGQLTQDQYLSLKNEADATRSARLNAIRYYGSPPLGWVDYH